MNTDFLIVPAAVQLTLTFYRSDRQLRARGCAKITVPSEFILPGLYPPAFAPGNPRRNFESTVLTAINKGLPCPGLSLLSEVPLPQQLDGGEKLQCTNECLMENEKQKI